MYENSNCPPFTVQFALILLPQWFGISPVEIKHEEDYEDEWETVYFSIKSTLSEEFYWNED